MQTIEQLAATSTSVSDHSTKETPSHVGLGVAKYFVAVAPTGLAGVCSQAAGQQAYTCCYSPALLAEAYSYILYWSLNAINMTYSHYSATTLALALEAALEDEELLPAQSKSAILDTFAMVSAACEKASDVSLYESEIICHRK